jgi:hypothetical protein
VVGVYFDVLERDFLLEKDEEDALDEGAELFWCKVIFCIPRDRGDRSSGRMIMACCPFSFDRVALYYLNYRGNMNVRMT